MLLFRLALKKCIFQLQCNRISLIKQLNKWENIRDKNWMQLMKCRWVWTTSLYFQRISHSWKQCTWICVLSLDAIAEMWMICENIVWDTLFLDEHTYTHTPHSVLSFLLCIQNMLWCWYRYCCWVFTRCYCRFCCCKFVFAVSTNWREWKWHHPPFLHNQ